MSLLPTGLSAGPTASGHLPSTSSPSPAGADYRRLNEATTPDRYPVPNIQDFSAHLAGIVIFSKMDLGRGYHQVPVHPSDVPKTAVIPAFGLFKFLRMSFGLKNAAKSATAFFLCVS